MFVVARVDVAKKVPVNAKSVHEDFEKKVSWGRKSFKGYKSNNEQKTIVCSYHCHLYPSSENGHGQ